MWFVWAALLALAAPPPAETCGENGSDQAALRADGGTDEEEDGEDETPKCASTAREARLRTRLNNIE